MITDSYIEVSALLVLGGLLGFIIRGAFDQRKAENKLQKELRRANKGLRRLSRKNWAQQRRREERQGKRGAKVGAGKISAADVTKIKERQEAKKARNQVDRRNVR